MSPVLVALVVFAFTFGGALAGIVLHRKLPAHYQHADSKDVVKLVLGLISTITALVLSLLISTAHTAYRAQMSEVQALGVRIIQLDRILALYGPDAMVARNILRQLVAARLEQVWPNEGVANVNLTRNLAGDKQEEISERVANLQASTDAQRFAKARALQALTEIGETRQLLHEQAGGSISGLFVVVMVFWLIALFVGFGFLAPRDATALVALGVGAFTVAGAIFLILDMNRPYSGLMQVSSAPIRSALDAIGQ